MSSSTLKSDIDAAALVGLVDRCLDWSMDGAIPLPLQIQFSSMGMRLRAQLRNLVDSRFEKRTQQLAAVNAELTRATAALERDLTKLEDAQAAIATVSDLVAGLDKLLAAASGLA